MSCISDLDCLGHGICNSQCECYINYSGIKCESCVSGDYQRGASGFCLKKCLTYCDSPRYICQQDPTLKSNLCQCKTINADPDKECAYCISGFSVTKDSTCEPISCVKDRQLCGNQGACIETDGVFSCNCNIDFTGTFCENCLNGKIKTNDGQCLPENCVDSNSKECSGFGKCDYISHNCICNHGYAGRTCQNCNIGFREYSNYYGTICLPDNCFAPDQKEPCSTNGDCVKQGNETFCQCYSNSSGQFCQDCEVGFELLDDGYCLPDVCEVDQKDCADNGYCVVYITGFGCYCHPYFDIKTKCASCITEFQNIQGQCIPDICVSNGTECNWHGYCLLADVFNSLYKCVCESGYVGSLCNNCDTPNGFISVDRGACVKPECISNNAECSNNGQCYFSQEGWLCSCNTGSIGKKCNKCTNDYVIAKDGQCVLIDCYAGNLECGGNGQCILIELQHQCFCNQNFNSQSNCVDCIKGYTTNNGKCMKIISYLSTGAIIGIIIAIFIIIVVLSVGIWFILKGNKRKVGESSNLGVLNKQSAILGSKNLL